MFRVNLAAGAAMLLASAVVANAAPTVFDFTTGLTGNLGESVTVTSGADSLTAYGFSNILDPIGEFFIKSDVTRTGNGFGVKNSFFDSGQIDNFGALDYLVLDLNISQWIPEEATFGNFNGGGGFFNFNGNDDYQIFGFDGNMDLSNTADFAANIGTFTMLLSDDQNPAIFTTTDTFRYVIFSGTPGFFQNNDNFRVASFTGTNVIPLPAALPLLATGLGLFGLLSRRRNRRSAA